VVHVHLPARPGWARESALDALASWRPGLDHAPSPAGNMTAMTSLVEKTENIYGRFLDQAKQEAALAALGARQHAIFGLDSSANCRTRRLNGFHKCVLGALLAPGHRSLQGFLTRNALVCYDTGTRVNGTLCQPGKNGIEIGWKVRAWSGCAARVLRRLAAPLTQCAAPRRLRSGAPSSLWPRGSPPAGTRSRTRARGRVRAPRS
jgi:hypothetical protein